MTKRPNSSRETKRRGLIKPAPPWIEQVQLLLRGCRLYERLCRRDDHIAQYSLWFLGCLERLHIPLSSCSVRNSVILEIIKRSEPDQRDLGQCLRYRDQLRRNVRPIQRWLQLRVVVPPQGELTLCLPPLLGEALPATIAATRLLKVRAVSLSGGTASTR